MNPEAARKKAVNPEMLIWVDEQDQSIGTGEKWQTHLEGRRHRAFSIFLFNSEGQMLLQQRSAVKYHSPLLWSNACCGHLRPGESVEAAAIRRLYEELGFKTPLFRIGQIAYTLKVDDLFEVEVTHLFTGQHEGDISSFSPEEVKSCRWISLTDLAKEIRQKPSLYTRWFRLYALKRSMEGIFDKVQRFDKVQQIDVGS